MPINKPTSYGSPLGLVEPLTEARAAYNEVLNMYAQAGYFDQQGNTNIVPFPSSLRSDIVLTGNNAAPTVLEFSFRSDQPNTGMSTLLGTDNRLDINDSFVARAVRLMFGVRADAAGTSPANAVMQQFPNPLPATGTFGGGFGPAVAMAVQHAYQGTMSLEVNAIKYMDDLATLNFQSVDVAQQGVAASAVAVAGIYGVGSFNNRKGCVELTPQMKFSGNDKTRFQLSIPDPITFVAAGFEVIVSLQLEGIRVQNGSSWNAITNLPTAK